MTRPTPAADGGFTEIADRVWTARSRWLDVTVTAVAGADGLMVVDTHASERAMRGLLADLRRLTRAPLRAVVHTHVHWDHVLGTAALTQEAPGVPVVAHEQAAAALAGHLEQVRREVAERAGTAAEDPEHDRDVAASRAVAPDTTFVSAWTLDLGDRYVEVVHPGRGHTDGDVVVRIPDAEVVVAGDVVEQSGPPAYGEDCWPLEWPGALDLVAQLCTDSTVVVPGHGEPVDRTFVQAQRGDVGVVAETVLDLASRGVPLAEALEHDRWPFPASAVAHAVRRGYAQVPRTARRLPLV